MSRFRDVLPRTVAASFLAATVLNLGVLPVVAIGEEPFSVTEAGSEPLSAEVVAAWREDLAYLYQQIESLHPEPFFSTDQTKFTELRRWIHDQIPRMNREQVVLAFMRLVALVGVGGHDGHSGLWPYMAPADFALYPLRLYWFEEGLYVVDSEPRSDLVGARLETINGRPVTELLEAVEPFISRDGPYWVRSWAPIHILSPQFHRTLGFGRADGKARFGLMLHGESLEITLDAVAHDVYHNRFPIVLWNGGLPSAEEPRYLRRQDDFYWYEEVVGSRTLYFQYNAVTPANKAGDSLSNVVMNLRRIVRSGRVDRLVLDMRSNGGGDNTSYGELLDFLQDDLFFSKPDRLFLVIGRMTFSAGVNFVTEAENLTNAVLVGEPTGGSPNQYGDPKSFALPNSGIRARVSTLHWAKAGNDDVRLYHQPHIWVPVAAADYFAGRDRAWQVIHDRP